MYVQSQQASSTYGFSFERSVSSLHISLPPLGGPGDTDYKHICDFLDKICRRIKSFSSIEMQSSQRYGKTSPLPRCLMRSRWYRVIYDLTTTQVQIHGVNIHNTRECVQCNNVHCHHRTMGTDTSKDCCRTAYGPQIMCPAVAGLPWCHHMAKNKTEWEFCHRACLHGIPSACSQKVDKIQKKDHIFGHYLAECIHICNLLHTLFSLTPKNGEACVTIRFVHSQYGAMPTVICSV